MKFHYSILATLTILTALMVVGIRSYVESRVDIALAKAQYVTVYLLEADARTRKVARLSDRENERQFAALRRCSEPAKSARSRSYDFIFVLPHEAGGLLPPYRGRHFYYDAEAGEVGCANQWRRVPEEFRVWMLTLKKADSIRNGGPPR